MIGTTETIVTDDPSALKPTDKEIAYLLRIVRDYFPGNDNNIIDQFAGVRVLLKSKKGVFRRPRDTLLFSNAELPGYFALIGGKLTAYRVTAERVIASIRSRLPVREPRADTRELKLRPVTYS
jgi:glycerol-3-phosphate dehydrogenase